jgi:hypothetical protein
MLSRIVLSLQTQSARSHHDYLCFITLYMYIILWYNYAYTDMFHI